MCCKTHCGPNFGVGFDWGIVIRGVCGVRRARFDRRSWATVSGGVYADTLGKGRTTFTGTADGGFTPHDIEVYSVI